MPIPGAQPLTMSNRVHYSVWLRTSNCVVLANAGITTAMTIDQADSRNIITFPPEV